MSEQDGSATRADATADASDESPAESLTTHTDESPASDASSDSSGQIQSVAHQSEPDEGDASSTAESDDGAVAVSFDDADCSEQLDEQLPDGNVLYETTPMLRPVVLMLGSVLVVGTGGLLVPLLWPGAFGDPALAEIALYAVAVLVTVTVVRLTVRLVVLWRTQYEIHDDALVRRYNLAYKRTVRKIPVSKLRGHEFSQSRYQASLGVGTIRLLTAGTNRSLGFLAFEHLKEPETVRDHIQTVLDKREHHSSDD